MAHLIRPTLLVLFAGLAMLAGCDEIASDESAEQSGDETSPIAISGPPPAIEADGHEAPHGGHIIELGRNHKFHAELVEDDQAKAVRVFILDTDMRELPIEASSIVLSLTKGGKSASFKLNSTAGGGRSAEFAATNPTLFAALHDEAATAKLRVPIQGATYVGSLEHHGHDECCEHDHGDGHDHGDHGHDHDGHNH